jgi:hypothetical protein
VKEMGENGEIEEGLGHRCQDPETKVDMVEFHVDEHHSFQDHSDDDAAWKIKGNSSMKDPLTQSPFVVEFEHGANSQGC